MTLRTGGLVMRPIPDSGGGGPRVPTWLRVAADNATALKEVFDTAVTDVDEVATVVGTKTESALPSVFTSVSATAATTYGSELTGVISFLGEEFALAGTRLSEYATAIRPVKDRAVELDGEISTAISSYADALIEERTLPDDAEDSEVQAAADTVSNRSAELSRLRGLLSDKLEEAYGLDRSYAAQLDLVTADIRDTGVRLGEVAGGVRNGEQVTVALSNLTTEIESDAESTPLDDEELAERHARDLEQAIADEDWDEVERILAEMEVHNDNPEYAETFTRELGPVGAAKLLEAAQELDDQETIRVIDVVNDTLMNGLAEYETAEMVEWVDAFAEEDGEDLDVLPLLLATHEGDGRVHAYSSKYFYQPEYFPNIDYDLIVELTGFDFAESGFEEFLASKIEPSALVDVLSQVDDVDGEFIIAVLFPFIPHSSTEEREQLLSEVLDLLGDPESISETDLTEDSGVLLKLLEWISRGEGDVDYHNEAIREFLNDPENLYYLLMRADDGGGWAEISAKMIDHYEEAGGDPENLLPIFFDYLSHSDQFNPENAGEMIGLLLALIEQADVEVNPREIIIAVIDQAAGLHKVAGPVWGIFKGILAANDEYQQEWEDFISDAQENADQSAIAFFLLMSTPTITDDGEENPITEDLEEFLAEYGLDSEGLESDPEAAREQLEGLASDPEQLQEMINKLKHDYPDLWDALREIEQAIRHGNDLND